MRIPFTRKLTLVTVVVVAFMALLGSVWFVNQVSAGSAATPAVSSPQTTADLDDSEPEITEIDPDEGEPGETLEVAITGENTNFSDLSVVTFLPAAGVNVLSTTVSSNTEMTVTIEIAPDARPGKRTVMVITPLAPGVEHVVERDGFEVKGEGETPPRRVHFDGTIIEIDAVNTDTATIVVEDEDDDHEDESLAPSDSITWTVHITAETRIRFERDGPATIADLEVGQEVKVVGQLQDDGSVLAHKILIEQDDEDEEREIGFRGVIRDVITGTDRVTLTVQMGALSLTVIVDDNTEIEIPDIEDPDPEDLEMGQEVKGKGIVMGVPIVDSRIIHATEIEVLEKDDDHRPAVRFGGTIVSLPGDGLIGKWTVDVESHGEVTFTVTERTRIVPPHARPEVGDEVKVVALRHTDGTLADGTLVALVIHVEKEHDLPPRPVEFRGTVVTGTIPVSPTLPLTIWVKVGAQDSGAARVVEVRVDERTRIEDEDLPIEEGDRVKVRGFLRGDIVVALRIDAEDDADEREVEFKGRIQRMTDDLWVVGGFTVQITDTTEITGVTPVVGLIAEVEGTRLGPRTVLASKIDVEDHGAGHRRVVVRGTVITHPVTSGYTGTWEIDVIGGDVISVEVTADTVVDLRHSGGTVETEMLVEVIAVLQTDGTLVAQRVRVFSDD